jgi:antitoxin MazE
VETKIQKWGNSLGVRIARAIAAEARVEAGSMVDVSVEKGAVRIRPLRRRPSLGDLLKGVTPGNLHHEIPTGPAVGREVW